MPRMKKCQLHSSTPSPAMQALRYLCPPHRALLFRTAVLLDYPPRPSFPAPSALLLLLFPHHPPSFMKPPTQQPFDRLTCAHPDLHVTGTLAVYGCGWLQCCDWRHMQPTCSCRKLQMRVKHANTTRRFTRPPVCRHSQLGPPGSQLLWCMPWRECTHYWQCEYPSRHQSTRVHQHGKHRRACINTASKSASGN